MQIICDAARRRTNAKLVWMTPPPVVEPMVVESWLLQAMEMIWKNVDLEKVAVEVRKLEGAIVDESTDPPFTIGAADPLTYVPYPHLLPGPARATLAKSMSAIRQSMLVSSLASFVNISKSPRKV